MTLPRLPLPVTAFDAHAATPQERLALGRFLSETQRLNHPELPPHDPAQLAQSLLSTTSDHRTGRFTVCGEGGVVMAYGRLGQDTAQNRHLAHVHVSVHPDWRRRGLGRAVANALRERGEAWEARTLIGFTTDRLSGSEPFARSLGAEVALEHRTSQLMLAEVDSELLRRWQTRPPGEPYRLHEWRRIPDEDLGRAAEMMMVMNTAPRGAVEAEDWRITPEQVREWEDVLEREGVHRLLNVIEDTRSGELVALSDVTWHPDRAALVDQGMTAVRPSARGQGLGQWVKAALTERIRRECPGAEYVLTGNAEENAAMLAINVALGFRPWARTVEWQWHI
ncbi:Acetyltransferase (GNAT) family protein [Deinococcus reticulitermitis]|uniref:Acetyltransferase (GNAT) family protein n=1 Tax=Deinococcus reticulitermitis TaxID=856736 RepID=A0A1H6WTL0_9DEIO|nr:GNAT family N-acetyltransferase [Deinococcus reticulitermitis]SEJ16140.1 Acetyltransferase (GNAT) family protein [Deinococcus reticulitermitis]